MDYKNKFPTEKSYESLYGDSYLSWKNWGDSKFGALKKTEKAYFKAEISRTKHKFQKGNKVLEIGFGNGAFLKYATGMDWDICGTEINHSLVKSAKDNGFSKVTHADNLASFNDDQFDLIVAFDVLEHIPQMLLTNFLLDVKRVLKKDGFFIARFPNGDSPFGLLNQNADITHQTVLGTGKMTYFASKINMKLVFAGGEAQPLIGVNFIHFIHRLVALPVKKLINVFVRLIFFPKTNITFCSSNLIIVLSN